MRGAALAACLLLGAVAALVPEEATAATPRMSDAEAAAFIDKMQAVGGSADDVRIVLLLQESYKGREVLREFLAYQREYGQKTTMVVTRPKAYAGAGYLRLGRNLWSYDASTGKWERRTERDQLEGSNMRSSDIGAGGRLTEDYLVKDEGEEMVGKEKTRRLKLTARPDRDVRTPVMRVWVTEDLRPIKSQDYSASEKLMRSSTTHFRKMTSAKGDKWFWMPESIRILDETDTQRVTLVRFQQVSYGDVPVDTYTKAWLEHRVR